MLDQIPLSLVRKRHPDILFEILLLDRQPGLQLHPESGRPIQVVREEIGPLPVIRQLDAVESVVSKGCCNLLEIEKFLLSSVETVVVNLFESCTLLEHIAAYFSSRKFPTNSASIPDE